MTGNWIMEKPFNVLSMAVEISVSWVCKWHDGKFVSIPVKPMLTSHCFRKLVLSLNTKPEGCLLSAMKPFLSLNAR